MNDPLAPLLALEDIEATAERVQNVVFDVHRHRANLHGGSTTAAEASVRAARASAGVDGVDLELPSEDIVTDPLLAGTLRVAEATEALLGTWRRAPLQALARMHVLAAADLTEDPDALGRPRTGTDVTPRLEMLTDLVTGGTAVPAAVLTAVVHGELLALRPFELANDVLARAAARLTMISTGLDPKALTVPEVAYLRRAKRYHEAAEEFTSGTSDGVRAWLLFSCEALEAGAREATSIADAALS